MYEIEKQERRQLQLMNGQDGRRVFPFRKIIGERATLSQGS